LQQDLDRLARAVYDERPESDEAPEAFGLLAD